MRKKILIFSMMTLLAVPVVAVPMFLERGVAEVIDEQVTLTVEGNVVLVNGAQGEVLEVVSLTGRQVAQYRIESASQRVELNLSKGCYVLKVGKVVRKVSIR
jgi:uncharacterized protein YabE (DUF348 family)